MKLTGKYIRTVYAHPEKGVTIAVYEVKGENITFTGSHLPTIKKMEYNFEGEWVKNPKYGTQFQVETFEEIIGEGLGSILNYLSSGSIKGIGKVLAERIIERFGENALDIIDNKPERLLEVRGITTKKLEKIKEGRGSIYEREVIMTLGNYGISATLARKAFQTFRLETMNIIENKPYMLCVVSGITFSVADAIGKNRENYEKDYERFKICAKFVLYSNEGGNLRSVIGDRPSGSTGMHKDDFGLAMLKYLRISEIDGAFILKNTIRMIEEGELKCKKLDGEQYIFLAGIYRIENETAECVSRLVLSDNILHDRARVLRHIKEAEQILNITLGDDQIAAVVSAFENNLSLIVGPPGTGKTTIIKVISYLYEKFYRKDIAFLAPTGKAASRMTEAVGKQASTIHSGVGIDTEIIMDTENVQEPVYEDCCVIVDEMSMVDARTAYRLFSAIDSSCKVVLLGDDEQLQSVGAGAVLRDMIDSKVIPITFLKSVYRQEKESNIYANLFKIRRGETDISFGDDFRITELQSMSDVEAQMVSLYISKVKEYKWQNVMLVAPFRNHDAGVHSLNKKIQELLNPEKKGCLEVNFGETVFRVGDVVMQLKNDAKRGVVNGDTGEVIKIYYEDDELKMDVKFSEELFVTYGHDEIGELTLAYAITVHKSQGCEAKCVITCIHNDHSIMLKRNLFNTAVTRGKEEVHIFGQKKAMERAIRTEDKSKRITGFKMLLRLHMGAYMDL